MPDTEPLATEALSGAVAFRTTEPGGSCGARRGQIADRGSGDEAPVFLEWLAVDRDPAAPAQIAHQIGVDGALVLAAALRVAGADRHVDRAADLLVEEHVAGSAVDAEVGADAELAEPARTLVGVEQADQVVLAALGARVDHLARVEPQPGAHHLAPAHHGGKTEGDLALDR